MKTVPTLLSGVSSMATRLLLADLADAYRHACGVDVHFESIGGVDAMCRVLEGEAFDVAVLAAGAIDRLAAAGRIVADSRRDLALSHVAAAVRDGSPRPDIGSEEALRAAVLAAPGVGYSTGPSGTALLGLLQRWGVLAAVHDKLLQAPAGLPVGRLLAEGRVGLAFQQTSELADVAGVDVLGALPRGCEIVTRFSAAVCTAALEPQAARALIAWLASSETAAAKRRHHMEPS